MIQKYKELGKLEIGLHEWNRFEVLADKEPFLWDLFWILFP